MRTQLKNKRHIGISLVRQPDASSKVCRAAATKASLICYGEMQAIVWV